MTAEGGEARNHEAIVSRCTCKPPGNAHYYVKGGGCILIVTYWPKRLRSHV